MAHIQQFAQGAHQLAISSNAGRWWLVKHEQGAAPANAAAALLLFAASQETRQLEALRLATAERGHRLAQLHVIRPTSMIAGAHG